MATQKTKMELLEGLTKDRLIALADKYRVVKVKKSMKKSEIIELIAKNKKVTKAKIPKK